ncbi:MAG TPA: patatin-like phospholipase family protein [Polyangiales bacterium]|nr:patatin-like phospholipase family protein [Polyangiales bacterium]
MTGDGQRQWFEHAGEPQGLEEAARAVRKAVAACEHDAEHARAQLGEIIAQLDALAGGPLELKTKLRAFCHQELARSYYDVDSPSASALEHALQVLIAAGLQHAGLRDQRTLCRGGEVHERIFALHGRDDDLEAAAGCFHAAHALQMQHDYARSDELSLEKPGGPGLQAAFLLDQRARRFDHADAHARRPSGGAERLRGQANEVRSEVLRLLSQAGLNEPGDERDRGLIVICAEAHFAGGKPEHARVWLERLAALEHSEPVRQACFRRLVQIAGQRGTGLAANSPAALALAPLIGGGPERVAELARSMQRGKVGLALSGGGHRAALYHLGVLARLADVDALREVEVISAVSGGSIVGALYYLALKQRLEQRGDGDMPHATYREIVREVIERYVAGVQRNVRMESVASLIENTQMVLGWKSHSQRIGELYADHFFAGLASPVEGRHADVATRAEGRRLSMHDLLITPPEATASGSGYNPKHHNWRRVAKVPVLMLNSTCLNTGHNWHFTATWMGEPPRLRGHEIDKNERLRRAYYTQELAARKARGEADVDPAQGVPAPALGEAVAASAGVPGLFPPMPIRGMYEGRDVQLVDGGSHDNQGVQALLAEGCTRILCSDASGQMHDENQPGTGRLGVLLRTSNILMDRVREVQLRDLDERERVSALAPVMFVHMRQGLSEPEVPWISSGEPLPPPSVASTAYEINCCTQERLANLRTDLDAFTDVEANALMCSGYLATRQRLFELDADQRERGHDGTFGDYAVEAGGEWPFLAMREVLAARTDPAGMAALGVEQRARVALLGRQLAAGSAQFFKAWRLSPLLRATAWVATIALFALAVQWVYVHFDDPILQYLGFLPQRVGSFAVAIALALLGALLPAAKNLLMPQKAVRGVVGRFALASAGYLLAKLHLWAFDRVFLSIGSASGTSKALFESDTRIAPGKDSVLPADYPQRWSSGPNRVTVNPALGLGAGE